MYNLIPHLILLLVCENANITCHNGGTCSNFNGKPRCDCTPLFSGKFCEDVKGNKI